MVPADTDVVVRAFRAGEWRTYRGLRLQSLADAPDAFGSTLAAEESEPDAFWVERLRDGVSSACQLPLVVEADGEPAGLAWCRYDDGAQRGLLFQMWVAPRARGRGAGRMLLDAFSTWARARGATELVLNVTCSNDAAVRLYTAFGFVPFGVREPLRPGSDEPVQPMRLPVDPDAHT